jgi:hypothetical protein
MELILTEEIIEDLSIFASEKLLEPAQFSQLLFDDDAPRRRASHPPSRLPAYKAEFIGEDGE